VGDVAPTAGQNEELLARIKERLPMLEELLVSADDDWVHEDLVYRFWHQSLKVYSLQEMTLRIVSLLEEVAPTGRTLHPWFVEIVRDGTGKTFATSHNDAWTTHTRPIVEAFFHARFMLAMLVRYGRELEEAPRWLPSGWAAVLELYGMR